MPPPRATDAAPERDGTRPGVESDARALERSVRALVDVALAADDELEQRVAPAHLRALQILEGTGPAQVSALADATGMLPSTMSRLSDRLDAAGLVSRRASPTNRRATLLELTPAGREVLDELRRVRTEKLRAVLERMDEADRHALLVGTRAFADSGDHDPQPPGTVA